MLEALLSNWPLKVLSLTLAFAIWVSITGENRVVQDFTVPLEIDLADNHVLASHPPTTVDVRLRGVESVMRRLEPLPMLVRVDLNESNTGEQEVILSEDFLTGVPKGVEVEFIEPARTSIVVDERARREAPLEPTFLGRPAEGYTLYNARLAPSRVRVEGPKSEIDQLEVLRTTPIRLDGRSEPFVARVNVVPEGEFTDLMDSADVNVRVVVDMAAGERRFEAIPIGVLGGGAGTKADPPTVDLVLSGPPRLLELIDSTQVVVTVDAGQLSGTASRAGVAVRADLEGLTPDERAAVSVKTISPREVSISLTGGRSL